MKQKKRQKSVEAMMVWAKVSRYNRAWFTKKGPGIEGRARHFFLSLQPWEQKVAVAHGWFPDSWLNLQLKPLARNRFDKIIFDEEEEVSPVVKPVTKGVFDRVKSFFGFKK